MNLHIIQFEHSGIPDEPLVTPDQAEARKQFEELLVQQGFRKMFEKETVDQYADTYYDLLNDTAPIEWQERYPNLKTNDSVHWWTIDVPGIVPTTPAAPTAHEKAVEAQAPSEMIELSVHDEIMKDLDEMEQVNTEQVNTEQSGVHGGPSQ